MPPTVLDKLIREILPQVEVELKGAVDMVNRPELGSLHYMLAYHMGWEGESAGPGTTGKRIRPLLLCLSTGAAGGNYRYALPAAAAVELIHNFSLIHDDIEDDSPLRRGRPTVWKKWGVAQGINSGDSMFSLAFLVLHQLVDSTGKSITIQASRILQETCLKLTEGQHLDLLYEGRHEMTLDDYYLMVSRKTASLLGTCAEIGALVAGAPPSVCAKYREFSYSMGLAFQVQDDLLGIWGDTELTGKSAEGDLVTGKKTLPVIYGLQQERNFAKRWKESPITTEEVPSIAGLLEQEGARVYTENKVSLYTDQALKALEEADPQGQYGEALAEVANMLLKRNF